ncbi:MAG: class D beta-lactamase [Ignavibacteria bacterium]|nr:class D beta-lactamase [Ignavibacteria bacterium]
MKKIILLFFLTLIFLSSCNKDQPVTVKQKKENQNPTTEVRDDFKKFYDHYNVEGTFVLYDRNANRYFIYNPKLAKQAFTPASTYKILNSLIGLETGIIKDENFVIPWDGVKRQNENWNKDHDLKTAYKNSTVWYYQELARRVGGKQMKHLLDTVSFGNADTTGGIDKFWLSGGLRISPEEQIEFLKKLHDNKLPFSKRSTDIIKNIMIAKDTLGYVVRAKTGWGFQDKKDIGWYVGYAENNDNVYYFANCIQSDSAGSDFAKARIDIVYDVLGEMKVLGK